MSESFLVQLCYIIVFVITEPFLIKLIYFNPRYFFYILKVYLKYQNPMDKQMVKLLIPK